MSTENAAYLLVETDLDDAVSADVLMQLGDEVPAAVNVSVAANLGNVGLLDKAEAEIDPASNETNELAGLTATYFSDDIDIAAGAQTEIHATPGDGKQLWIFGYVLHAGTAAGTYQLMSDAATLTGKCSVGVNGGASAHSAQPGCPLVKCDTDDSFDILTVGCTIDGSVYGYEVTL